MTIKNKIIYSLFVLGLFFIGNTTHAYSGTQFSITKIYDSGGWVKFASTTPTGGKSFCLTDDPYNSGWGVYGSGYTSPSTCTYDLSSWSLNIGAGTHNYLISSTDPGADPSYYAKVKVVGGVVTADNVVSGITQTQPYAQTYEMNPITFAGTYTNINTFDQLQFKIINTTLNKVIDENQSPYLTKLQTIINEPYNVSKILPYQGNYTVQARLYDSSNGTTTAWSNTISFALGTTTVATSTINTLPGSPQPLNCDSLDIGCHLKNALMWIFYPSDMTIDRFKSLSDNLKGRSPFIYAYQAPTLVNTLYTSSQTASTTVSVNVNHFGTITLLSEPMLQSIPFANTVKTVIGYALWLGTVLFIYHKIIKVHDPNTHA